MNFSIERLKEIKEYYEKTEEVPDMVDMVELIPLLCDDLIESKGKLKNLHEFFTIAEFEVRQFYIKEKERKNESI